MRHALQHLQKGVRAAYSDERVRGLLAITFSLVLIASVFYRYVEGWGIIDSIYFSVITIATVGYGDLYPQTILGKVFTMGYVLCGIGLFVALATAIAERIITYWPEDK